jgi:predicted metal-binding membrane protein
VRQVEPSAAAAISATSLAVSRALGRDRRIVIGGLLVAVALSWGYLLAGASMSMSAQAIWTAPYFALMLLMWWIMMAAMMLPSAAPTILLFVALRRKSTERGDPVLSSSIFVTAYVIVWGGFSLLATFAQMQLDGFTLLSPMMKSASVPLGAALLIGAGVYQLTPFKYACLRHCRTPIDFFARRWRRGAKGALLMGLEHGGLCLGCCWVIMGLLFYAGVMNLLWVGGLTLYVLIEKLAPAGQLISRFAGIVLILWGAAVLVNWH